MAALSTPVRDRALFLVLALAMAAAGCARGAAETGAPAPALRTYPVAFLDDILDPGEPALRVAERAELTGLELGTMWTFENPPLEYWRANYGFEPTADWLDHVRLASVRYGEVCSASFVSGQGLVMTNHHCARECIEDVSTEALDYLVDGFLARTGVEEQTCPGLYLDQLVAIEDVTARVRAAAPATAPDTVVAAAVEAERAAIEEACEAAADRICQVVRLYHGGQYQLYQYRRYEPVKLVFAPELQAGFYGGDPDNFTYPRYTLDVAFVRAYLEDGETPADTPDFFRWNAEGAQEGELVFVTGNPGSTSRLITVAQLIYEQRFWHPFVIELLASQVVFLERLAAQSPELERLVRDDLFSVRNAHKAYTGQMEGLRDTLLVGQKIGWEREFRDRIRADPALAALYGDIWDRLASIQAEKLAIAGPVHVTSPNFFGFASPDLQLAMLLVRYLRETARPEAERLPDFRGDAADDVRDMLVSPAPFDPEISIWLLENQLEFARRWLAPDDPILVRALEPGETTAAAARRLANASRIGDPSFRREMLEAGLGAVEASPDPLLAVARLMEARHRELVQRWDELEAVESVQEERLGNALFAAFGTGIAPDATFTLRITDGVVARYPFNGTYAPPWTTYHGLFDRAAGFGDEMPWTLPPSVAAARDRLEPAVRLNFVTTNDITGGNSGSPMIDRDARIVGVAFDGNIEQLPNEFLFRVEAGRSIGVHSAAVVEALRSIYPADALLSELIGAGQDP